MATHSSILAWKILETEAPGGLQSTGSQSRTQLSMHSCICSACNLKSSGCYFKTKVKRNG